MRQIAAAAPLALLLAVASPAAEAQMAGVDPQLYAMLEQMISFTSYNCQMGNPQACANVQGMQAEAQYLIQAGQYCMQTNDPNACGYYRNGVMQVQMAYGQMAAQMQPAPAYDPMNPLGATHEDRMQAIQQMGATGTQNFNNRMEQMDQNQAQFLDYIRQ